MIYNEGAVFVVFLYIYICGEEMFSLGVFSKTELAENVEDPFQCYKH